MHICIHGAERISLSGMRNHTTACYGHSMQCPERAQERTIHIICIYAYKGERMGSGRAMYRTPLHSYTRYYV